MSWNSMTWNRYYIWLHLPRKMGVGPRPEIYEFESINKQLFFFLLINTFFSVKQLTNFAWNFLSFGISNFQNQTFFFLIILDFPLSCACAFCGQHWRHNLGVGLAKSQWKLGKISKYFLRKILSNRGLCLLSLTNFEL